MRVLLVWPMLVAMALTGQELNRNHHWTERSSLGFTKDWGNTEVTDVAVRVSARRDSLIQERLAYQVLLDVGVKYKNKNAKVSHNEGFLKGLFRYFTGKRFSWTASEKIDYDEVKSLRIGTRAAVGIEYWLWHCEDSSFQVGTGLGYIVKRYQRDTDSEKYISNICSAALEHRLSSWLELRDSLEVIFPPRHAGEITIDNVVALHASFDKHWGTQLSLHSEYDNSPAIGKKKLDNSLQWAVTHSF